MSLLETHTISEDNSDTRALVCEEAAGTEISLGRSQSAEDTRVAIQRSLADVTAPPPSAEAVEDTVTLALTSQTGPSPVTETAWANLERGDRCHRLGSLAATLNANKDEERRVGLEDLNVERCIGKGANAAAYQRRCDVDRADKKRGASTVHH
eukprot:SAG31_NODE_11993_length_979_cov_1.092045_1_plen_153_part_00